MLAPKRIKFRKTFKGRTKGIATRGNTVAFGEFGLMSLEPGWVTNRQIEASRVAMTREMKRGGKVWIRIFPDKPITKKPAETRMGKGKGNPEGWVAVVKPGRIMFEIEGISEDLAKKALALAQAKLPVQDALRAARGELSDEGQRNPGAVGGRREGQARRAGRRSASTCASGPPPSRSRIRCASATLRRDIARLHTILREKATNG